MKYPRVSIAASMGVIVYLGLAFAALAHPTPVWSEVWLSVTLGVLALATLGAVYGRRPFWGGVAIVGGGFLAQTLIPGLTPRLVTYGLVEWHYRTLLSYVPAMPEETVWVLEGGDIFEGKARQQINKGYWKVSIRNPERMIVNMPTAIIRPLSLEDYQGLCHSILAIPVGLAGGLVARRFASRVHRPSPAPEFGP